MKQVISLAIYCCIATVALSQEKPNWNNTFIYTVRLPTTLAKSAGTKVSILYNGKSLQSKKTLIGGKLVSQSSNFFYSIRGTNTVNGWALPFAVPANCFIWLLDGDMLIEMVTFPNRYHISVNCIDSNVLKKYVLPVTFDFITDNALNIGYLQKLGKLTTNALFAQKTWLMSIEEKNKTIPSIRDTILTFSLRSTIPKGILKIIDGIDTKAHANQEFIVNNCFLYKGQLFFPFVNPKPAANKIISTNLKDQCQNTMIDIQGNTCATQGCITGVGAGKCMGLNKNNTIAYTVQIVIEP